MCYLPRNAVIFYDANKQPVAFIELCFSCLKKRPVPGEGIADDVDFPTLAAIFAAHQLPFGGSSDLKSFTQNFKEHLKDSTGTR